MESVWEEGTGAVCVRSEYFKVEGDAGQFYCNNVFWKYVKKGDEVRFVDFVLHTYFPVFESQRELKIELYSADSENLRFITDVGSKNGRTFSITIPTQEKLGFKPKVEVSMFFGTSKINVAAVGKNFSSAENKPLTVKFERDGIF